jgi:hypothetical protein
MTFKSIGEYVESMRARYLRSGKKEKGKMLDEFTNVTGCHRKAAIRLFRRLPSSRRERGRGGRGRPLTYGNEVTTALKTIWEASDHLCSKRLQPFLPEIVSAMIKYSEIKISAPIRDQLMQISSSTIDRQLQPHRRFEVYHSMSTTKPGSLLKSCIPIRTFTDWEEDHPGFVEADLVAHCGDNAEGFYLNTLSTVDVATGWSECVGVWGKGQYRVGSAVHQVKERLPFPLLGLDSDNGSEFINQHLFDYCQRWKITFTRSRSYKKNDNCYVEQKNWSVVRRLIGYDRYSSHIAFENLNRLYHLVRLYINYFQPVMKLVAKSRHGARVHKVYDKAQTPYQRLLQSGVLSEDQKQHLASIYYGLNPVQLRKQINANLESLWKSADRTAKTKRITEIG